MGNEFDDIEKGFCPIFYRRILRRSDDFSSEKMAGHIKFKTEISTLDIFWLLNIVLTSLLSAGLLSVEEDLRD